jgi:hypothetical protein
MLAQISLRCQIKLTASFSFKHSWGHLRPFKSSYLRPFKSSYLRPFKSSYLRPFKSSYLRPFKSSYLRPFKSSYLRPFKSSYLRPFKSISSSFQIFVSSAFQVKINVLILTFGHSQWPCKTSILNFSFLKYSSTYSKEFFPICSKGNMHSLYTVDKNYISFSFKSDCLFHKR